MICKLHNVAQGCFKCRRNSLQRKRRRLNPEKTKEFGKKYDNKRDPAKKGFNCGLVYLRKTLTGPIRVIGGWPDAGPIEVKIGADYLGEKQWIRAAWLKKYYDRSVAILWAKTYEDAAFGRYNLFSSISSYVEFYRPGALHLWKQLLKKVPR